MKKAGIDNGNYAMKLWVGGKVEPISIPTVFSYWEGESTRNYEQTDIPKEELLDNIDITIESKAIELPFKRFVVGKKVVEDNMQVNEPLNHSDKSTDDIFFILGLTGLAMNELQDNYDKNKIKADYDVSLALPVTTISQETANLYSDRFIGQHEVTYHHPSGRDQKVILNIDYARTLPEGSAGAWGIIYNEDGSLKKYKIRENGQDVQKNLEDDILLHFDIGAGTTEEVITYGVSYKPNLSTGYDFGVKQTIEKIIKKWNVGRPPNEQIDSITEFNKIYFDKEDQRNSELIMVSKTSLFSLAGTMSQKIINKIDQLKTKPVVFIYGGGAVVLEEYIREVLYKAKRIDRVLFLNDPINVTAKGLLVYTLSPRYQAKKEEQSGVNANG